jgi:predicted ATPase
MKYNELVHFEPIQSVVQLTDADHKDDALRLLDSYVISDRMSATIADNIIEQLQFERPVDNKGILVVGNYGSGKSHLMSVISTLAEYTGTASHLKDERVAGKATQVEGKFKVIRLELGSTRQDFRGIITSELEVGLANMGIDFEFPRDDEIINNKSSLLAMMEVFNKKYPDKGLLIVVDELLDYLRSRKEQELTLDLGFLREVGEITTDSRLRFMAGIQERIFDNPAFSFVSDALRRVQERFMQVRIVKEDIAYVISERLLKKTPEQKSLIRTHLEKFTRFYSRLSEDMETYVNLFPIHPAYLSAFEKVHNIEKRVALNTISSEMQRIIDARVPEDYPGTISFDSYWQFIEADPSNKTIPEVKEVLEKSSILKDRVANSMNTNKQRLYGDMSIRIINALSLYRVSSDDIYSKIGLTSEELRDGLFLTSSTMGLFIDDDDPAESLKTQIDAAIKEIMITVNYQFITANEENGQYYLDLKKDIDIDSQITNKAELIEADKLDSYYFDLMKQAITLDDNTYVTGFKIWKHEIPWQTARVMRQGYLFFGSPNERSTAQPERDFYVYLLRPFNKISFVDNQRKDEVFIELNTSDLKFENLLKRYAAAKDLQAMAAQATRQLYSAKILEYQKRLLRWLTENFVEAFDITYRGKTGHLIDLGVFLTQGPNSTVKETVDDISSEFLSDWFEEKYSDYPHFTRLIPGYLSSTNIAEYTADALQQINGRETKMGAAILNGLVLLDEATGRLNVQQSGRAQWIMGLLDDKGRGKVLNNDELFNINAVRGVPDRRLSKQFMMEPELVVVLLAALLHDGKIEISVKGENYTAVNYTDFISLPVEKLTNFSYIKKSSDLPKEELDHLFDLYDQDRIPNLNEVSLVHGIKMLLTAAQSEIDRCLQTTQQLRLGYQVGGKKVIDPLTTEQYIKQITSFKDFSSSLIRFNSVAKLKNLSYSISDITDQFDNKRLLESLSDLKNEVEQLTSLINYIDAAEYHIGQSSNWSNKADYLVNELIAALRKGDDHRTVVTELRAMKQEYIDTYINMHQKARLNASEDKQRNELLNSNEVKIITQLAKSITILPEDIIDEWKHSLQKLTVCYGVSARELQDSPECPTCRFNMSTDSLDDKQKLNNLAGQTHGILDDWIDTIMSNLKQPSVVSQMDLLEDEQKGLVETIIRQGHFDYPIDTRLIQILNELFKGLVRVEVTSKDLNEIFSIGKPMTINEFEARFKEFLYDSLDGKDRNRVRIIYKGE